MDGGEGARVWDVDGNEYLDFHNGFSAMVQGHAHPAITAAVGPPPALGTHFGATDGGRVEVAEELARRFGLERWRFTNSGTESVMDAIRIARGLHRPRRRGEDLRLLPRPCRHDDGQRRAGARRVGCRHPGGDGDQVHAVPFNDADAMAPRG